MSNLWDKFKSLTDKGRIPHKSGSPSPYLLDLKKKAGALDCVFFDFPQQKTEKSCFYLRQRDRWLLPPSYRTGLALMAAIMFVSLFGIAALDATTMAEAQRSFLNAQIIQGFTGLSQELEHYAAGDQESAAGKETGSPAVFFANSLQENSLVLNSSPVDSWLYAAKADQQTKFLELGLQMNQGFEYFDRFVDTWLLSDISLPDRLDWMQRNARKAIEIWGKILQESSAYDGETFFASEEEISQFEKTLSLISEIKAFLMSFNQHSELISKLIGSDSPRRILLLFQDPQQKRATGGALDVGIELLLDNGEILLQRPFHVSEYDSLLRIGLQAPQGLEEVTERWDLANANSFLDVPQSVDQIHWFWQREARSSVDLVLLVNTNALEELFSLELMKDYLEAAKLAELENLTLKWSARSLNGETGDLKYLATVIWEELLQVFRSPDLFFKVWPTLQELAQEKQIMAVSLDPDLQAELSTWGVSSPLPKLAEKEDLLLVSSINTENNSTDRWIDDRLTLHTAISDQGVIKHWLKIERTNSWNSSYQNALTRKIPFPLKKNTFAALSSAENKSLIRVLVPKGSVLTAVNGKAEYEISTNSWDQYTSWNFELKTDPGEKKTVEIYYELPWSFDIKAVDNYRLQLVKQAGSKSPSFNHLLKLPANLTIFQSLPEAALLDLDRDRVIAVVAGLNP